jgi:hypothetical protein
MGIGAPSPRTPSGTATSVMSPETIARATTSVVPVGRHPLASGLKTCVGSVMVGGGDTVGDGEAIAAVGVAVLAAAVAAGVGDDAADVAAGGPDDEQAQITTTLSATAMFLTRGA